MAKDKKEKKMIMALLTAFSLQKAKKSQKKELEGPKWLFGKLTQFPKNHVSSIFSKIDYISRILSLKIVILKKKIGSGHP